MSNINLIMTCIMVFCIICNFIAFISFYVLQKDDITIENLFWFLMASICFNIIGTIVMLLIPICSYKFWKIKVFKGKD